MLHQRQICAVNQTWINNTNFNWFHVRGRLFNTRTFPSDPLATMGVSGPPGEDPGWRLKDQFSETRMGGSLRMQPSSKQRLPTALAQAPKNTTKQGWVGCKYIKVCAQPLRNHSDPSGKLLPTQGSLRQHGIYLVYIYFLYMSHILPIYFLYLFHIYMAASH